MSTFAYAEQKAEARPRQFGLIVLETDETIERDFRRMLPKDVDLLISRIPFPTDVSPVTLQGMADHVTASASLFPRAAHFAATGYGCTSGAAQIGPDRIAELVQAGCHTDTVTEPVSALVAACRALQITRLAFLSPYVEAVSGRLRTVLAEQGIECPLVGTFDEPDDSRVARIAPASVQEAALALARDSDAGTDGVFLSCTNLQTLDVIAPLEAALGKPVLSSNLVLGWHMMKLAGLGASGTGEGLLAAA